MEIMYDSKDLQTDQSCYHPITMHFIGCSLLQKIDDDMEYNELYEFISGCSLFTVKL